MDSMKNYNYVYNMSYKEVNELDSISLEKFAYEAKQSLFGQILSDRSNNVLPFDKAYRFQVRILNGMDVVAKCEEIPIMETIIKMPEASVKTDLHTQEKLSFKNRLKVLLKGKL